MKYSYPIIVIFFITACTPPVQREPIPIFTNTPITQEPQQHACTRDYRPVCAKVPLYCVTAPCPSREQTFSNQCMMRNNRDAIFLYEGECLK